jgi:hypothetical protein
MRESWERELAANGTIGGRVPAPAKRALSVETAAILREGAYSSGNARRIALAELDYKRAVRAASERNPEGQH